MGRKWRTYCKYFSLAFNPYLSCHCEGDTPPSPGRLKTWWQLKSTPTWFQALSLNEHPFHSYSHQPSHSIWDTIVITADHSMKLEGSWDGGSSVILYGTKKPPNRKQYAQAASPDIGCWESKKGGELGSTKASPVQTLLSNQQMWAALGRTFAIPYKAKLLLAGLHPMGMQGCGAQGCSSCQPPYNKCKFLRGYLATIKDTLSPKDRSLSTASVLTSLHTQGTHSQQDRQTMIRSSGIAAVQ